MKLFVTIMLPFDYDSRNKAEKKKAKAEMREKHFFGVGQAKFQPRRDHVLQA